VQRIRAFIAIELPGAIQSEIEDISDELARAFPARSVRWVPPGNIHLTLKFLGDIRVNELSAIAGAIDRVAAGHDQHELCLSGLGCFPNKKRPRVFWIGLNGDIGDLRKLHGHLSTELSEIGWEPESRPFHPHLTLGRVKDSRAIARTDINWELPIRPRAFHVINLVLFESILQTSGASYRIRHEAALRMPKRGSQASE